MVDDENKRILLEMRFWKMSMQLTDEIKRGQTQFIKSLIFYFLYFLISFIQDIVDGYELFLHNVPPEAYQRGCPAFDFDIDK